ncbi:hypothetical protein GH714_001716 [Hevea brasiliensis]|uniref:1-phosphatidylinositol-4-phosphate 5-kinase n=1 Tax=Hevea brasiliensis TaxID=3981 RepID=A0A6A6L5S7_HEVBR|nr:hypothetical protein GH714_001716 [Hevea brasiliensis]
MRGGLLVDERSDVVSSAKKKKSGEGDKVLVLVADKDNSKSLPLIVSVPQQPIVVNRARSQSATRRVTPTNTITAAEVDTGNTGSSTAAEKLLPNGDLYMGSFSGNAPHGSGKYLWTDGCMYEGEWRRGKASGKGKFSWPSGATFEGEFKSGRMEGFGTFIGSDGDTYRGSWSADRKHGPGQKRYANGDFYEGMWKKNLQDGKGRYVWKNGNVNKDIIAQELNGAFYSGNSKEHCLKGSENDLALPATATRKRSSVDGARGSNMNFPRICIWESDGEAGDITCDIIDTVEASMIYREGWIGMGLGNFEEGRVVLMVERYSVGKHAQIRRDLKPSDFDPKEKFWTRFPPEGSKITPPHQSVEFRWKDYCPMVFRHLRELFQVDTADYMLAICGNDALRELSSPGKSGSFFYLTQDDRFMIKTVKKSEVKTRFIVMGNLFCSEYRIHRRFDLKGSSHGRTTDKPEGEIDETTTLKDLDLNFVFRLQRNWYQELIKQINRDCEFLEAEKIMDYSLLVGLHFRDDNTYDKMGLSPFVLRSGNKDSYRNEKFMRGCRFLEAELQDRDRILSGRKSLIRLGANMPARAERMARRSDFDQYTPGGISYLTPSRSGEVYEVVLYFGIIDILQDYDISKKLEHAYKSLQADPSSISAVDPKLYSKRFRDFIGRIFIEDR